MDTETIDRLYLELSQFTGAKTNREMMLERIARAADAFEDWLGKNSGTTADWPIKIKADKDGANEISKLLNDLAIALKPFRTAKPIPTGPPPKDGVRHGIDCHKVLHISMSPHQAWQHESNDDGPFDVDGVRYCGRCHYHF